MKRKLILFFLISTFFFIFVGKADAQHFGRKAKIDKESGGMVTADIMHNKTHEGTAYDSHIDTLALADDASHSYVLTASVNELHVVVSATSEGDSEVFIYQNAVLATAGTELTPTGLNWAKDLGTLATRTTATAVTTPTFSNYGVEKDAWLVVGGTGGKSAGGSSEGRYEYIVPVGSNLHARQENEGGGTKDCAIHISYYEMVE